MKRMYINFAYQNSASVGFGKNLFENQFGVNGNSPIRTYVLEPLISTISTPKSPLNVKFEFISVYLFTILNGYL